MKQGNTARNAKIQLLKIFFDSIYRGHFPDIAIATTKFPISRYRDDRDLSVCLSQPVTAQLLYIILYHSNLQIFSNFCNYSVPLQPLNCPINAKFCATEAVRLPNYYNTCTTQALRLLNYYYISCTTLAFRLLM